MLVLSRQVNQKVIIDLSKVDLSKLTPEQMLITVTIVDIRGNKVRLGVDADKGIPCHRDEVYADILAGNTQKQRKKLTF